MLIINKNSPNMVAELMIKEPVKIQIKILLQLLLTWHSRLNLGALIHIHLHAHYQQKYPEHGSRISDKRTNKATNRNIIAIIESLESVINKLTWSPAGTEWSDYYQEGKNNYVDDTFNQKRAIVSQYIDRIKPATAWDLGANCGVFSRIVADRGIKTIAMDIDPAAVELNYLMGRKNNETTLVPIVIDLTNPSPSIGWQLKERMSLLGRGPVDVLLVLALIHHLVIGNNVPILSVAKFFSEIARYLIIEYVPQEDSQVQLMLATRKNIFEDYDLYHFRQAFQQFYELVEETPLAGSNRTIFLMRVIN